MDIFFSFSLSLNAWLISSFSCDSSIKLHTLILFQNHGFNFPILLSFRLVQVSSTIIHKLFVLSLSFSVSRHYNTGLDFFLFYCIYIHSYHLFTYVTFFFIHLHFLLRQNFSLFPCVFIGLYIIDHESLNEC